MQILEIRTRQKDELIEVTHKVKEIVRNSGVENGILTLFVPHTTAAVTINENADPDVKTDMIMGLNSIVPYLNYDHMEGNSRAHIKSSLIGASETILIENGRLLLGTWQGIYFCEFDGPRTRKLVVNIL